MTRYRNRNTENIAELLVSAPWWISAIILVVGNIFLRSIIPAMFSKNLILSGALKQAIPSLANIFSLVMVGLMIFSLIRGKLSQKTKIEKKDLPYKSRQILFTAAELNFLRTLEQSLKSNYRIFGQVRLADIINPSPNLNNSERQKALNRITSKHVDFVICNATTFAIETVIELDDRTHELEDRVARDIFLENALETANVPIARFTVKRAYTLKELQEKLNGFIIATQEPAIIKQEITKQNCEKCGNEMIVRRREEKNYWVCKTYPECRNVIPA